LWTKESHQIKLQILYWFWNFRKIIVADPLASSPRRPIATCPGPRVRGSAAVAWSPPGIPPPRAGGPSAAGHALDTGSHRPHVRHPLPEEAPILSSLRPKPFCFPLLAAERHCQGHLHSSSPCRAALHNATLATPLLCSGRRRAADSSRLMPSWCAPHRC
jgi:hypothetical protein